MNNDKYAKYGKQVTYASNGAYRHSDTKHGGQEQADGCAKFLLAILLTIGLLVGSYIVGKASSLFLESVSNAPLYVCMLDSQQSPNQDASYPPEGYHCRPHFEGDSVIPTAEYVHVRKDKSDDGQAVSDPSPVIESTPVETSEPEPTEDTPSNDEPQEEDNDSDDDCKDKKDKHPNNGGGNGQEGEPDLDPNDNEHANDND